MIPFWFWFLKVVVHSKMKMCWNVLSLRPFKIRMSLFLHQIWRNVALHQCLSNGCSAVNGCRQNESPNITIIHTTPVHQLTYWEDKSWNKNPNETTADALFHRRKRYYRLWSHILDRSNGLMLKTSWWISLIFCLLQMWTDGLEWCGLLWCFY